MIDTSLSSFERDVIEASTEVPVIVAFWAPWCGPCKALGPMMERLEREYGGRFRLVNVNADTNPELVASFSLKSIPYAVAFVDANAVAQFQGAQPEPYVRAFLDRLIPNPGDLEHRHAREALAQCQFEIADGYLRNAIALDPANDGARLDMMGLMLDRADLDGARSHFGLLSPRAQQQSTYSSLIARLQAVETAALLPPSDQLEQRIQADPADLQARLDLADVHVAFGEYEAALGQLLEITRHDRKFGNDVGRTRMLQVFEMAAGQPDVVAKYRGRLSMIIF